MDSEVKFGLDNSFTSNESGSASDSVLSTPWESEALTRPSLIQVDFSSINDSVTCVDTEKINNDNLQSNSRQSSSLNLDNYNQDTMSVNKDKKVTDSNDSNNSTSSNSSKSKSFKHHDIKSSNQNIHNNSIAVMNNIDEHKFKTNVSKKSAKPRKPWYSVFTNTYKQKNEDFHRLFKLPSEEILLVDYSCALQREILAHGRLYVSLNYVCFRANIIGWETTVIIRLKDIRSILKDKTAKIIPNAISLVLDQERYFLTSFTSRDKTYTTLFRVWQNSLTDSSMTSDEINGILKACYGEDLGYNSDDIEYDYYSKLKSKQLTDQSDLITVEQEENNQTLNSKNSSPVIENKSCLNTGDFLSLSDDQVMKKKQSKANESLSSTSFVPRTPVTNQLGHRHSSSYDTSIINTNIDFTERPRSMVVDKKRKNSKSLSNSLINENSTNVSNENSESSDKSSQSTDVNNNEQKSDSKDQSNLSTFSPILNNSQSTKKMELSSSMIGQTSMVSPSPVTSSPSEPIEIADSKVNNNAKCSCSEHNGKELMNLTFNMSVNQLFECLFGHTEFCQKYWESRKFGNLIVGEWKNDPVLPARRLEYTVDLGGALGRPKNTEDQKILEYRSEVCIVLESSSMTHNVPYSDYFMVKNRFCITRITANQTRITVNFYIFYKKNPNFIVKSFIEKNSISAIKDSFSYIANIIKQSHDEKCHEPVIKKIEGSLIKSELKEKNLPDYVKLPVKTGSLSAFKTDSNELSPNISADLEISSRSDNKIKPYKKNLKKRYLTHATENRIENQFIRSNSENNAILDRSNSNQSQTIQQHKFSFFGLEIHVDTLIRLFIVAMVCLMIINGILYYKLRRIESLADDLKSDPNLLYKTQQLNQVLLDSSSEKQDNWKFAIKNTLEAISKMEQSLKQLNKNFKNSDEL